MIIKSDISIVKLITYCFITVTILFTQGCNPEEFQEEIVENICKSCQTTEHYNNEMGVIREIVIGANQPGGSYNFFYHNQYTNDRPYKLYVITTNDNDVVVPCVPLSDDFKIGSLAVVFSGSKMDCCNVLTHTNWRASFGCMIDITSLDKVNN